MGNLWSTSLYPTQSAATDEQDEAEETNEEQTDTHTPLTRSQKRRKRTQQKKKGTGKEEDAPAPKTKDLAYYKLKAQYYKSSAMRMELQRDEYRHQVTTLRDCLEQRAHLIEKQNELLREAANMYLWVCKVTQSVMKIDVAPPIPTDPLPPPLLRPPSLNDENKERSRSALCSSPV